MTSARLFVLGIARHWWALVVGGLLGALDLVALAAPGLELSLPQWAIWAALGAGVAVAAVLAYHDMRMETSSPRRRRELQEVLGRALQRGEALYGAPSDEPVERWATDVRDLLREALGEHAVARFTSDAGITQFSGKSIRENFVSRRCQRLREILEGDLDVREDIDLSRWAGHFG